MVVAHKQNSSVTVNWATVLIMRLVISRGTQLIEFLRTSLHSILYFIVFTAAGPATIFTAVVRTGLDASSDTERISAE